MPPLASNLAASRFGHVGQGPREVSTLAPQVTEPPNATIDAFPDALMRASAHATRRDVFSAWFNLHARSGRFECRLCQLSGSVEGVGNLPALLQAGLCRAEVW